MSDRDAGWLALAAGIVLVLTATLADVIGYGPSEDSFGLGQIIITILGLAIAGYGTARLWRAYRSGS